jgi:hypothetical protein
MNTTIADFVLGNPSNSEESKEVFEASLDYDEVLTISSPTLVYIKDSNIIAWYEIQSNIGFK